MRRTSSALCLLVIALGMLIQSGFAGDDQGQRQATPHFPEGSLSDGLVAYYPFNGNAQDASGNVHHGTVYGVTLTTDRFGIPNAAYAFNGTTNYIEVANAADLNPTNAITYAGWFLPNTPNQFGTIVSKGNDQQTGYYVARLHPAPTNMGFAFLFNENQGTTDLTSVNASDVAISAGQWYHFAVTYDGTTARSYINGVLRNTVVASKTLGSNQGPLSIGRHPLGGYSYLFNGKIDDVRLYSRALSGTEIADLYSQGVLNVTLYDAEDWGQPGSSARVVLYNVNADQVAQQQAGVNSQVAFTGVPQSTGYYYRVHIARATPWGEQFWGEKTGITITGSQVTTDVHTHNTPYMPGLKVYIDSTNEELPDGGKRLVRPGTRLRIEVQIKNPGYAGAQIVSAHAAVYLDRNKTAPYDATLTSVSQSFAVGTTKTATILWNAPAEEGEYFLSAGAFAASSRYDTCLTDASSWHDAAFRVQADSVSKLPWKVVNTGVSHTIVIPVTAAPGILGVPLNAGDYIGVFHDSSGTGVCAGFERWTGVGNIAVAAFGDDPTTTGKDGFASGEVFQWRVFRKSDGSVFNAEPTYAPVGGLVTNTNTYALNGISQLTSLEGGISVDCRTLRAGWSLIGSHVTPLRSSLDSMFRPVLSDLVILKNGAQKTFIPSIQVNGIGPWVSGEGYQIKMQNARSLCISGQQIIPEALTIALPFGWSIIPYVRDTEMPIAAALSSVEGNVILVKDQDGKSFVPSIGVNSIGTMKVGQAYQIKMANARNFQYPEQYAPGISDEDVLSARQSQVSGNVTPWTYSNTGISHTVILPANTNPTIDGSLLSAGDYIGIFYDSTGTRACAGFEEWTGTGPLAITAFGDDPTTSAKDGLASGETLQWKIWRKSNGISYTARSSYVSPGGMGGIVTDSSKFNANGISAVASLVGSVTTVGSNTAPTDLSLMQNYPNPFNPNTMITFGLPERSEVRLVVYSVLGEIVAELADGVFNAGYHTVQFNGERLASGVYYYRLQTSTTVRTRQMLLMR